MKADDVKKWVRLFSSSARKGSEADTILLPSEQFFKSETGAPYVGGAILNSSYIQQPEDKEDKPNYLSLKVSCQKKLYPFADLSPAVAFSLGVQH